MTKAIQLVLFFILLFSLSDAQQKGNDVTSPLHAMKPDYPVPYGTPSKESIIKVLDKIFNYLDAVSPAQMINKQTGNPVSEGNNLDTNTIVKPGDFRITSYEWGVTYGAMLIAFGSTGDKKYADYVKTRFDFLNKWVPLVKNKFGIGYIQKHKFLHQPSDPQALDDAGAVCAAMIKSQRMGVNQDLGPLIYNYIDFISNKQFRLNDGTLARNRPQKNTLWLDDLFMSIPALAQMGKLTGDKKYFDDAVKQLKQFANRMFIKEKGLYMHGWVEGMEPHPQIKWARANGWALLATVELLDALPENYPGRDFVLQQLKAHAQGLAALQSGTGFWHQLLDREDSYLETSATAIYAYCIAHACIKGWLDPMAYGPVCILAWNAVTTKITDKGQVEGTCVGTGMAFDPAFYYYRPVNVFAAHGYGPALMAGAEMIQFLAKYSFNLNDSAVQLKEKE
jgi:unsaturated rhamnogalacturonyl hydrolase